MEENLIIRFDRPRIRYINLIALVWLTMACANLIFEGFTWRTALYAVGAVVFLWQLFFDKQSDYVQISGTHLTVRGVFKKKIKKEAIDAISTDSRMIVIQGKGKTIRIHKQKIHPDDLEKLHYFDQLPSKSQ